MNSQRRSDGATQRRRAWYGLAVAVFVALAWAHPVRAADAPAFAYDRAKTATYLEQTIGPAGADAPGNAVATALRQDLAQIVDEILDGPWQPLLSDYSAGEAGGVGIAEWCFNRPGEYLLALAPAAPYLDEPRKAKARQFLQDLIKACPPTRQVYLSNLQGKPRNLRKAPPPKSPAPSGPEAQRRLFEEAYAVWAYAHAFGAWDEVRPLFDDLKKLRGDLERRGDFAPAYKPEAAGPLTAADTKDPEYRFRVYQALLAGCQDNYGYAGARAVRQRMVKDQPVFFYVKALAALIGYHRLAQHFGDAAEAQWARQTFEQVAELTLTQQSAPYLWSDPALGPEVGRLLRDAAGSWLDELARTPNVGDLPATDWNGKVVPGKRDHQVMDPFTWYHAWGGQGEGVRPRTVMGAFLVNAYLFNAPPERIAQTLDVPWCPADLYHVGKVVVAIRAAEKAPWVAAGAAGP